jgi:hypothetical protein
MVPRRISRNRRVQILPTKSPWLTKNVWRSERPTFPESVSGSHQEDWLTTLPEGSMMAEMPVFPQRAIQRLVSIALREA